MEETIQISIRLFNDVLEICEEHANPSIIDEMRKIDWDYTQEQNQTIQEEG